MKDRYKKVAAVFIPIFIVLGIFLIYTAFFNYGLDIESKPVKILDDALEHKVVIKNTSQHQIKNIIFSYPGQEGKSVEEKIAKLDPGEAIEKNFKTDKTKTSFDVYAYAPNHMSVKRTISVYLTEKK